MSVEIRAVNNRYLKLSYRAQEPYHLLEAQVEKVLREFVRRGSIQINLRCRRLSTPTDLPLNQAALESYLRQVLTVSDKLNLGERGDVLLSQVLMLPGVIEDAPPSFNEHEKDWVFVETVLREALERLQTMRQDEGRAMADDLLKLRESILSHLESIRERAPLVVEAYRERLRDRMQTALQELEVDLDQSSIIREVALFADRSDISEEIVRLSSHLDQFSGILSEKESVGRKLEFLAQEMGREANTIGSKANDIEIARSVVEIKGALEKIREMIQNVE